MEEKYRTGLPVIDVHQKETEREIEKLSENRSKLISKGKELPKLPVGTEVLYEFSPDSDKTKCPKWCKGIIKDRFNPYKYEILTDSDRVITQSRKHKKAIKLDLIGVVRSQTDSVRNRSNNGFKTTVFLDIFLIFICFLVACKIHVIHVTRFHGVKAIQIACKSTHLCPVNMVIYLLVVTPF